MKSSLWVLCLLWVASLTSPGANRSVMRASGAQKQANFGSSRGSISCFAKKEKVKSVSTAKLSSFKSLNIKICETWTHHGSARL